MVVYWRRWIKHLRCHRYKITQNVNSSGNNRFPKPGRCIFKCPILREQVSICKCLKQEKIQPNLEEAGSEKKENVPVASEWKYWEMDELSLKAFSTYHACPSSPERSCSLESSTLSRISHPCPSSCSYFSTTNKTVSKCINFIEKTKQTVVLRENRMYLKQKPEVVLCFQHLWLSCLLAGQYASYISLKYQQSSLQYC